MTIHSKANTLDKLLFILTIVPAIFQDLPLAEIFGTIAKCPVIFFAPFIFCIILLRERKLKLYPITKYYLYYFIITVITSIIMMFFAVAFTTKGIWGAYAEFFPLKLFKASQYTFVFVLFSYNAYYLISKVSTEFVFKVFQGIFIMLTIYGIAEFIDPYPLRFIHNTLVEEWKTRLVLTGPEPSTSILIYACVVLCILTLRLFLNKNKTVTTIFLITSIFILLAIGSKSGVVFIIISLIWALRKNFSFKYLVLSVVISIPIIIYVINFVVPELLTDIDGFSSFSTRTTTILVAFKSLFIFPIGQGYGTYIVYFPEMLLPMNKFLANLLQLPLLDYELEDMVNTGKYLGVKSGILQEVLYNGIIAVVFFYWVFKNYFTQIKLLVNPNVKLLLAFSGIYCLMELLFTAELLTAYYYLFPFLLVFKLDSVGNKYYLK